ncbi:hypothetical protein ABTX60_19625 [Streptomyces sp. NPDC126510]
MRHVPPRRDGAGARATPDHRPCRGAPGPAPELPDIVMAGPAPP